MRRLTFARLAMLIAIASTAALAEDAQSIMRTAIEKKIERAAGVDLYVIDQTMAGHATKIYMKRFSVEASDGSSVPMFVAVGRNDAVRLAQAGNDAMTPEGLEAYADGAERVGEATAREIESGLEDAGLPRRMLSATTASPWVSLDPRATMGGAADFARAAADAKRQPSDTGEAAQNMADSMAAFVATARLEGSGDIDGRSTFHLVSNEMNIVEPMDDGEEFRLDSMHLWMDKEEYVPLKMTMEGMISSASESRPVVIETLMSDYREVPGSNLYEPYRQVMTVGGMLNDEQKAQMVEAKKQLAEFDKQLKALPPSQKQMMESMMGSQLEQVRKMAEGGDLSFETVINAISVNPEL